MWTNTCLVVLVICCSIYHVNGDCKIEDFDTCAQQVSLFGNRNLKVPSNDAELDASCNKTKTAFACVGKYVKECASPFTQAIFGVLQFDAKKAFKKRCMDPVGRKEFLKFMQCGAKKENLEPFHVCVDNYMGQLNYLTTLNMNKDDRLGGMCCSVIQLHHCFINNARKVCDPITGAGTGDYLEQSLTASVSEGMDYTCSNYRTMDMCDANMKPDFWGPLKKIGQDAKKEHKETKFHSPLTTLVKFFEKLK